jgi:heptosyltransferase-1
VFAGARDEAHGNEHARTIANFAPATKPRLPYDAAKMTLPPGARVLVVRLSALGDVLFALETVASLKAERPDARVDFLIEDRFADLLAGHPQLERVLVYPRRHKLRLPAHLRNLRQTRYDAVLDLHGILKSAAHVVLARGARKLGYSAPGAREGAHRFYREKIALPQPLPHRAERGTALLRALGLGAAPARPVLAPPDAPPSFWQNAPRPRVVLHPGTSAFAAFKRWPAAKFTALGERLRARGIPPVVSFGPGEEDLAQAIAGPSGLRLLDGRALGLRGLGAVFAEADVVVAADTGPLHIAAAAGAAVVALFGPKDVALYGPRAARQRVLFADVPCRPCKLRVCPSPQCVLGVDVDAVVAAVLDLVAPPGSRSP